MERFLFKRIEEKNGKKETRWYYWYYDENGKQVKKTCGKRGKPCLLKRDALAFLAELEKEDEQKKEESEKAKQVRLCDISENMYEPESTFIKLCRERGRDITEQTMYIKKHCLKIFLEKFGLYTPASVDAAEIENWLIELDYSNAYKNQILTVINEVFSECRRYRIIENTPVIDSFKRRTKKKDTLTLEQIQILFPADFEELENVWKSKNSGDRYMGIDGVFHNYGIMFGVMFMFMLSTGMRPGEARALQFNQLRNGGLFIDKMLDVKENLQSHLKKGNDDEPKFRTVLIPKKMQSLLSYFLSIRPNNDSEFLFTYRGHTVSKGLLEKRFNLGLMNTGIAKENYYTDQKTGKKKRIADKLNLKLTPHSLRFTYNTYTVNSNLLPGEVLRKMIGHNSEAMTDYYTRTDLEAELKGLQPFQNTIDEIWNV